LFLSVTLLLFFISAFQMCVLYTSVFVHLKQNLVLVLKQMFFACVFEHPG